MEDNRHPARSDSPAAGSVQETEPGEWEESPGRVRGFEAAAVVAALCLLAYLAFRWTLEGAVHNRPVQTVPDLKAKSIAGVLDVLAPLHLSLMKEGTEFSGGVPVGSVLRQRPPAGTKVREGKTIRVVISQGGETVFTPSAVGLPLRNAEMLFRQNLLTLGQVSDAYSLRFIKGLVLSQEPQAESSVERNAAINVSVSAGPPPGGIVLMPDFQRKDVSEVSAWASVSGIKFVTTKDANSLFPYGTVLSQEPGSDAVVSVRTSVKIVISSRAGSAKQGAASFRYQVPQGSSDSLVRIVLVDGQGEREIFNGLRSPGSKLDIPLPAVGQARVKIFLNGTLIEERNL